jgi:putative acyl-CoA dehydrogenase
MNTFQTHEVSNQPVVGAPTNLFSRNIPLMEAVKREGATWAVDALTAAGSELGNGILAEAAVMANKNPPTLKLFDRYGRRADEVEFHPAYHQLMGYLKKVGMDAAPWANEKTGSHVARAAHYIMYSSIDNGTQCPITMTYGSIPVMKKETNLAKTWMPKLLSHEYDSRFLPIEKKRGALIGMGMTEKQGGSDVRANTTQAIAQSDGTFRLVGHKWFFSAPMCDGFFVTAQSKAGLSCFFVPRFTPDGNLNEIRIQRLKDKLGDKSNASSEVEFCNAWATLVGEEGRGIPTILEMGTYTRLDCALGTTGLMRFALNEALNHAHQRKAFGKNLSDQPMMQNVLADMSLEVEASIALSLRLARAFEFQNDEHETLLRRVLTPASKFLVCKRGSALAAEAMEVLGGIGYVEESATPRIFRQMPLNSIWEGSGNVMCLDVLRALAKYPQTLEVLEKELGKAVGHNAAFDSFVSNLSAHFKLDSAEAQARILTGGLATAIQASLLIQFAPNFVSDAFCNSRMSSAPSGQVYGTLSSKANLPAIVSRAFAAPN